MAYKCGDCNYYIPVGNDFVQISEACMCPPKKVELIEAKK